MGPTIATAPAPAREDAERVRAWARTTLQRGSALIVDTETTDLHGRMIQISVIDLTGAPLLSTLVAAPEPIVPGAAAVHGITDHDLVGAPRFEQIAGQLLHITTGRTVLAYNADFDREVVVGEFRAAGLEPAHLGRASTWQCILEARTRLTGGRRRRLNGPHNALEDCRAALAVLRDLATEPVA